MWNFPQDSASLSSTLKEILSEALCILFHILRILQITKSEASQAEYKSFLVENCYINTHSFTCVIRTLTPPGTVQLSHSVRPVSTQCLGYQVLPRSHFNARALSKPTDILDNQCVHLIIQAQVSALMIPLEQT